MKIIQLLTDLGIQSQIFIAGMSGGIAFVTKRKDMNWTGRFLTVLSGGFTANYLTPLVVNWLHFSDNTSYGVAFLLGYSGMKSVEVILLKITERLKVK